MVSNRRRRGAGTSGGVLALLLLAAVLLFAFSNTPEGKRAFQQTLRATQPPTYVSLSPFAILSGYYVNVTNTADTSLTGVTVTYTGAQGEVKRQNIGVLRARETKTLDPSDIGWTVVKHETISVSADGYVPKTVETNSLIQP